MFMNRRKELLKLAREPEALVDFAIELEARVRQLESVVKELKEQLAKNSRNSGKPPSSDGLAKPKPKPKSLRSKSGKKPGGQNGHTGRTLQKVAEPDHTVLHQLNKCPCGHCRGRSLRKEPILDYEKRQVFELPKKLLEVTEHCAEIKRCPVSGEVVRAQFPPEVRAPAQYGPRFKAVQSYLNIEHLIPFDRLGRLVQDIFGQPLSEATVVSANQRIYHHLQEFEMDLVERLVGEALVHFDESGVRVAGKLHWLHVASTAELTFYGIHPKRGKKAMDQFGILPRFQGWAMHDHFASYLSYENCIHAFCNEHHLRELKFQAEENGESWAAELSDFLLCQKKWREQFGLPSDRKFDNILDKYHAILAKGRKRHPRRKTRAAQSKAASLLDRLEDYDLCVLAFLLDLNVPFTNNQGEQDIRMIKTRQKISGGFRTLSGAWIFARIRSYVSTCRKQGRNILQALEVAYLGGPIMVGGPAGGP